MNRNLKYNIGIFAIRWWAAGAVYFFIGWGTPMGSSTNTLIDIIFLLTISMWIFFTFIINPSIKMLLDRGWHLAYKDSTYKQRFFIKVLDFIVASLSVTGVLTIYEIINTSFGEEVFLPGEPLLFGLFYAILASLVSWVIELIRRKR